MWEWIELDPSFCNLFNKLITLLYFMYLSLYVCLFFPILYYVCALGLCLTLFCRWAAHRNKQWLWYVRRCGFDSGFYDAVDWIFAFARGREQAAWTLDVAWTSEAQCRSDSRLTIVDVDVRCSSMYLVPVVFVPRIMSMPQVPGWGKLPGCRR